MKRTTRRYGLLWSAIFVCLVPLTAIGMLQSSHREREAQTARVVLTPYRDIARFVVADLDGDRKPDMALVEMQNQRSAATNYSIRLHLSRGTESAIGVSGPFGGLRVAAQDVNGDANLDLIVTSNLDSSFVQVLLNDGQGNFSLATPGEYEQIAKENDFELHSPVGSQGDRTTLASVRGSHDGGIAARGEHEQSFSSEVCSQAAAHRVLGRDAISHLGRSPPTRVIRF